MARKKLKRPICGFTGLIIRRGVVLREILRLKNWIKKQDMADHKIQASIKNIKDVLEREKEETLSIPDFQRPYCWNEGNVRLLLQDVYDSWKSDKHSYRIGSVILYKYKPDLGKPAERLEIVDGQQRITTILLMLRSLTHEEDKDLFKNDFVGNNLCKTLKYEHIESQQHISENNEVIKNWIKEKNIKKQEFYKYLVENCTFVEIVVTDLSEAFQMFDSQNGRGKELEAYNLLKAYHIRSMENETQDTKKECDRRWESATIYKMEPSNEKEEKQDILKQVINEQLYRTRKWSRKAAAYEFNKSQITEFKGSVVISKQNAIKYPFQNSQLLQYIAKNYFESIGLSVTGIKPRFINGDSNNINPFVLINQNIINGKQFFDYIETYIEIYKNLFVDIKNDSLKEFKSYYSTYCEYEGAHRTGDAYLKEVYKSLIFIVFDKYGEVGVNKYYKLLYVLMYRLRLEKKQVKYNSVAQYPTVFFSNIENSTDILDIDMQFLGQEAKKEIKCEKEIKEIIPAFIEHGITIKNIDLNNYKNENQ